MKILFQETSNISKGSREKLQIHSHIIVTTSQFKILVDTVREKRTRETMYLKYSSINVG